MFLQNIGYTALLLGVLVFVHEFGHFLIAKLFNVKVLRFSIGFGPPVAGFTWGETEYRIAWVPLGGYVKMAGELPSEELPPEDARRGFLAQAPWKRALIVAAGPAFNLVFPVAVYFFIFYLGLHQTLSSRVGSVEAGLPAAQAGIRPGDRILAVDGEPIRTFEDLQAALRPRANRRIALKVDRGGTAFETEIVPARTTEQNAFETVQRGLIGISSLPEPPLLGVPAGSPAAAAGLKTFDRVLSVNGRPVHDALVLNQVVAALEGELDVAVARARPLGLPGLGGQAVEIVHARLARQPGEGLAALGAEPTDLYLGGVLPGSAAEKLGLQRGDRLESLDGRALPSFTMFRLSLEAAGEKPQALAWRSAQGEHKQAVLQQTRLEVDDDYGQKVRVISSGILSSTLLGPPPYAPGDTFPEGVEGERMRLKLGAADALRMALHVVPDVIRKIAMSLGFLLTGKVGLESLGGPVMLYQIAKKSAELGLDAYLTNMAFISVNLGLINLLPIPILDGFQLLAATWEGVRRRPIPMRAREVANMIGLAMLLILMVIVLKNDITR